MGQDDEDEDEDEDDHEIGSDCHILDLSTTCIGVKLWVHKEYIRIYDVCHEYLKLQCAKKTHGRSLSVVITGQPGIGKSYWIFYTLHRRLCEGKPVIWYHDSTRYLFVAEGVYILENTPSTSFKTHVWTLVDTDEDSNGMPPHLAVHLTQHFLIFTTTPQRCRWRRLGKTTLRTVVIMNPWTRAELSEAAEIYGLKHNDPRMDDMFNQFGPTPRICFGFLTVKNLLSNHESDLETALGKLSSRNLLNLVTGIRNLSMDDESHTILLVRRRKVSNGDWGCASVGPITDAVRIALRNQLRNEMQAEQLQLYRSMANVKGTRRIAGVVFELLAHSKLLRGIELTLIPMVKGGSSRGKKSPQWRSNHGDCVDPPSARQINIGPTEEKRYSTTPARIKDKVYYVPEAENQVGFDSFIKSGTKLYIFQFSIASKHQIMKGITSFFTQESLPPHANWNFVFVVPTRSRLISCPQSQDRGLNALLNKMNLFTAVLDIE
ncbi:hypothetical protein EDB85DRAFT_2096392 [Lactarius pseudohatsudake]|nr:hypothetical protein EDB85DRAFT_2096392 [Lactarius pseudohatsudake]